MDIDRDRLIKASKGYSYSAGGLNKADIYTYFSNINLSVPQMSRTKLNTFLSDYLAENTSDGAGDRDEDEDEDEDEVEVGAGVKDAVAGAGAGAGESGSESGEEVEFSLVNEATYRILFDDRLINRSSSSKTKRTFAIFDLDDTLTNRNESNFKSKSVSDKLIELAETHIIAIVSNQYKTTLKQWEAREEKLINEFLKIDVPVVISVAFDKDRYRKPNIQLLKEIEKELGYRIDKETSFFCGDAAGRKKRSDGKKDFSISDRFLAHNFGIKFYTDTEYFNRGNRSESYIDPYKSGITLVEPYTPAEALAKLESEIDLDRVDVIIMVGPQASGKTTLAKELAGSLGFTHLEKDKFKSRFEKKVNSELSSGNKVVVDFTGATENQRNKVLDVIPNEGIIYVYFNLPKKLIFHMDFLRSSGLGRRQLPNVAIHTYFSRLDFNPDRESNVVVFDRPVIAESYIESYFNFKYPI